MSDLIERLRALSRHEHDDLSIGDEAAAALAARDSELAEANRLLAKTAEDYEDAEARVEQAESVIADLERTREMVVVRGRDVPFGFEEEYLRQIERAEQAEAKLARAMADGAQWKRETELYSNAWQRELRLELIPETHLIDSLVLSTRAIVEKVGRQVRCCGAPELCSDEWCNKLLRYRLAARGAGDERSGR